MGFTIKRINELVSEFKAHYIENKMALNLAKDYGVRVHRADAETIAIGDWGYRVIGVYHLTREENEQKHHVYIDVLNPDGQRVNGNVLEWQYEGEPSGDASPPFKLDKNVHHEPSGNLGLWWGMVVSLSIQPGSEKEFSDIVSGLKSMHPDESKQQISPLNTLGHHSFYVVFWGLKETGEVNPPPPPVGATVGSIYATDREGEYLLKFDDERSHL